MASPNTMPHEPVIIEYDWYLHAKNVLPSRVQKEFTDPYKARQFYARKQKAKRNPKVINPKKEKNNVEHS